MRFCNISNRPWLRRICLFTSFLGWVWNPTTFVLSRNCRDATWRSSSAGIIYSSPPSSEPGGSLLMPYRSGFLRILNGWLDPDSWFGSGLRFCSGGVDWKTWGMNETLQEKATRLTLPDRALIWVAKAGPPCAATARGAPVCFLRGSGLSPSPAWFFLAVFSAVPGRRTALRGGRPLRLRRGHNCRKRHRYK